MEQKIIDPRKSIGPAGWLRALAWKIESGRLEDRIRRSASNRSRRFRIQKL